MVLYCAIIHTPENILMQDLHNEYKIKVEFLIYIKNKWMQRRKKLKSTTC